MEKIKVCKECGQIFYLDWKLKQHTEDCISFLSSNQPKKFKNKTDLNGF